VPYVIVQDLTPALNLPLINTGDLMTGAIYNEAARILDFAGAQSGGGAGGIGGGGGSAGFGGDMLAAVYDTNKDNVVDGSDGPLILASPATNIGIFPGAIAVPRYNDHPDKSWTYGPYDDHFDGTFNSNLSTKWTAVRGNGQIYQSRSHVHIRTYTGTATPCYIQGGAPGGNFQASWKWKFFQSAAPVGAVIGQHWVAYYAYIGNTMVGGMRLRFVSYTYPTVQAPPYNQMAVYIDYGPNVATTTALISLFGTIPEYWGINVIPRSNSSVFWYSYDGQAAFGFYTGLTNAQAGFASGGVNVVQFVVSPSANADSYLAIDWYRVIAI
jgi:hypothetical protein